MRAASKKYDQLAEKEVFFATKVFYWAYDDLKPMDLVVQELWEAKTEDDIESILKKYKIWHNSKTPVSLPFLRSNHTDSKCEINRDIVPSYASWLQGHIQTLFAYLELYTVCLSVARTGTRKTENSDMFRVLYTASKTYRQMIEQVHRDNEWIPIPEDRESRIRFYLRHLPIFPLITFFDDFQRSVGSKSEETYRPKSAKGQDESGFECHYWEIPESAQKARSDLRKYVLEHLAVYSDTQYITKWQPRELAAIYMEILDEYLGNELYKDVNLKFDALSGKAMLISADLATALTVWLFVQVQSGTSYKVCKMCGKLFILGSQPDQRYCHHHTKNEIDYFNKKLSKSKNIKESVDEDDTNKDEDDFVMKHGSF